MKFEKESCCYYYHHLSISALAVLAYLEIHLTHFLSFVLKEALKIAILTSFFLSYPL